MVVEKRTDITSPNVKAMFGDLGQRRDRVSSNDSRYLPLGQKEVRGCALVRKGMSEVVSQYAIFSFRSVMTVPSLLGGCRRWVARDGYMQTSFASTRTG